MPFSVVCPVCNSADRVEDAMQGQHVSCNVCLHRYVAKPKRARQAVEVKAQPEPPPVEEPQAEDQQAEEDIPTAETARRVRRRTRGRLGLCHGALALGFSALSFAAFAGLTYVPLVLGALGLIAAVMSLVLDKRSGLGMAFATLGSLASTIAFAVVALKAGGPKAKPLSPEELAAKPFVTFPGGRQLQRTPRTDEWADATKQAVEVNGLYVGVAACSVGSVQLQKDGQPLAGPDGSCLVIHLRVVPAERIPGQVSFAPWSDGPSPGGDTATLTDANGNKVLPVTVPRGATIAKHPRQTEFFPAMYVEDVLVFPAPDAEGELKLTLPAEALGGVGPIRFKLTTRRIGK